MSTGIFRRGVDWLRGRGLVRSAQSAIGRVEDALFDRVHGLETSENVYDLDIDEEAKQHSASYQPTRVRHFRKLMQSLKLPREHVFVDVGCGKGRILVAAAQHGFRGVVGIEISPSLSATAARNVEAFQRRSKIEGQVEVICSNISDFAMRHNESIFYLFYPFDRSVTETFLAKVRATLQTAPREMWLIINNPLYPDLYPEGGLFGHHSRFLYGGSTFEIYRHQP